MHKNACSLLWTHAAITLDGKMQPCCRYDSAHEYEKDIDKPIFNNGFVEGWLGEEFNNIRQRMLTGEKLPECKKCWDQEEFSGSSMRTGFNSRYSSYIGKEPVLKYLELGFSTHCNLACRMCDEYASTTIYKINHPNEKVRIGFDIDLRNLNANLQNLEEIKIVGGEPMSAKNHPDLFDAIFLSKCDTSKLKIVYHTNCTVLPAKKIVDYWQKIGKVVIVLSIDGYGHYNEIQRLGHKWNELLEVLDFYLELRKNNKNIEIKVHSVMTAINIMGISELTEFLKDTVKPSAWELDAVSNRPYLALHNMSEDRKNKAYDIVQQTDSLPTRYKNFLSGQLQRTADAEYSIEYIEQRQKGYDQFAGQKIRDYL